MALIDKITAIADAIRAKTGGTEALTLDQMATEVGEIGFDYTAYTSVVTIPASVFRKCSAIRSATCEYVQSIGSYAFEGCVNLKSVSCPKAQFYQGAFANCVALVDVSIPAATTIPAEMFYRCTALKQIDIPATVTSIADTAFGQCTSLETINFAGTVEQWNAIEIGENWLGTSGNVPATVVNCSDGTVSLV